MLPNRALHEVPVVALEVNSLLPVSVGQAKCSLNCKKEGPPVQVGGGPPGLKYVGPRIKT